MRETFEKFKYDDIGITWKGGKNSSLGHRPPAPEAVLPLYFDPFWLSSSHENVIKILT